MSRIGSEVEPSVKRQMIAPGIFIEKFQEKVGSRSFYVMRIELKLFTMLDFTVDFSGSNNVRIENQEGLVRNVVIQPFQKLEIARLLLEKKWNIKTKFKFTMQLPSLDLQRQHLEPYYKNLKMEIQNTEFLKVIDFASMPDAQTFDYFAKRSLKFIDHDFLPTNSTIDISEQAIIQKYESLVHWRRIKDFLLTEEEIQQGEEVKHIFSDGITPMDVKQGKLGDCWLLSSIASLAEFPRLVQRVILIREPNRHGYYKVKLCKMSKWKIIPLDDYFPCTPLSDTIFSKNMGKEFWVLLLEKAFAKMYGSYGQLVGGHCKEGLIDLTGCPTFHFDLNLPENQQKIISGEMWRDLIQYDQLKYLVTAGTKEFPTENPSTGLVKEHAYSILRVVELDNVKFGIHSKSKTTKLLNLRNPWGIFEWTGDWADDSKQWTAQIKDYLKTDLKVGDGSFWISWENFLENFESLTVCKIAGWHELRLKGKFVKGIDQSNQNINHFCSRWYYEIEIKQTTKIILGVHQEDERYVGVKDTRPYIDIGISLLSYVNGVYQLIDFKKSDFLREQYLEVTLEPGIYFVVPQSIGNCLNFDQGIKPEVNDFSSQNPLVTSVIRDIFEKYDIIANEFLSYKELKSFYDYIGLPLTEYDYNNIVNAFGKKEFKDAKLEGLSEKGFINLFYSLINHKDKKYIKGLFEKLGYNSSLFSYRTRIFMLTIHSEKPVNLSIKDGLQDNIDFTTIKLLIKKFGKSLDESKEVKPTERIPEVEGFYFFNE